VARTRTKILISMMRPNRSGSRGPRMTRTANNPKNRDHGRLLQQCEKSQSRRRSEDGLVWSTRTPGGPSIPASIPEDVESRHKACRISRASGQIPEFHSASFVAHVNHGGPGCLKSSFRKSRYPTGVNSLAASMCCAPILRRMYPRASPTPEHQMETMSRTMNNVLSLATNVRA